jgi:glycosidase
MEFHISRKARDYYQFDEALFSITGNVIFTNFQAARTFTQKLNQKKDLANHPEETVKVGEINAMGLIDEVLHYVIALYREQINPETMGHALEWLYKKHGKESIDKTLYSFVDEFPPVDVYKGKVDIKAYLKGHVAGIPNSQIVLEEMLMLWLANMNPAFSPYLELFDETTIKKETIYLEIISGLKEFFEKEPVFGPDDQSLIDMLRSPAVNVPHSLQGQLDYIRERWISLVQRFLNQILGTLDLIKEERKLPFMGPGPVERLTLASLAGLTELEAEQFSPDKEWMPRLILMAKNIYVWLDQLSKKYARPIATLDLIPDEELALLRDRGFTGLWLIGIWERSSVSQEIKKRCGNPEAVPSAYSLFDYTIAEDLGGEAAYESLRNRAWQKGVRLASDMVPNHVGIYSRWVLEHPDWFVSLDYNPFPWYAFHGEDLSPDDRIALRIEDHYYSRTDAAVVFKRLNRRTGEEKYLYHGNDGTSMPWNDTAQLNYLNAELREAMIQTILHVARKFPIIRFDAAMTLTKKHYQRLWFPEPGSGGAIPTRSEYGMTKGEFDSLMPAEFWREVVDRVAAEVPDTLLLAEAFWLLEGFFVRTLGMHRVYNSAFMNMLRDEDNAGYRTVMKNILEFDPEILRRLVNFMNNPDERTSVDQFGKDHKYFGTCILMITLPGLPMFGHGQIEGFAEKYGMEYRRPYWDETPDSHLIQRHDQEIFPLLHRRRLFAGVDHFLLYDFFTGKGGVNEDVFAHSNRFEDERSLVVYHNRNSAVSGWIKTSVAYSIKKSPEGERELTQRAFGEGLGLKREAGWLIIFKDHMTNLEYIRKNSELHENGMYIELGPYTCYVFVDFREIQDNLSGHYSSLASRLNGRGVASMEEELKNMLLEPVHSRLRELMTADMLQKASDIFFAAPMEKTLLLSREFAADFEMNMKSFLREVKQYTGKPDPEATIAEEVVHTVETFPNLPGLIREPETGPSDLPQMYEEAIKFLHLRLMDDRDLLNVLYGWAIVRNVGKTDKETGYEKTSRALMDELLLGQAMEDTLRSLGFDEQHLSQLVTAVAFLTTHQHWNSEPTGRSMDSLMELLLNDSDIKKFIRVNRYREVLWFSKEGFDDLIFYLLVIAVTDLFSDRQKTEKERAAEIARAYGILKPLLGAAEQSGYQVEKLLEITKSL